MLIILEIIKKIKFNIIVTNPRLTISLNIILADNPIARKTTYSKVSEIV